MQNGRLWNSLTEDQKAQLLLADTESENENQRKKNYFTVVF